MNQLRAQWSAFLDRQHRYPTGLAGRLIGERMVRQHAPETSWTIKLLDVQPGDRVLELGCGAGRGLALALQSARQVTGVDLSRSMLASAVRRNRAAQQAGQLALLRGDLAALPFAARSFTKIFSIHTFYFWPEPLVLMRELVQLLDHSGVLAITLATGQRDHAGAYRSWPLHQQVEALVQVLQQEGLHATLQIGPDSRQYNNVAIVVRT